MSTTSLPVGQRQRPLDDPHLVDAPIWRRVVARLIDIPFSYGLAFVYIPPIVILSIPLWPFLSDNTVADIGAGIVIFLGMYATEWLLLARRDGQTLGKGLVGLKVVRETKHAEAYAYRTAALRMFRAPRR